MPDTLMTVRRPRRIGERYEYMSLVFWPENGFIYVEDRKGPGGEVEFVVVSRRDWLLRAQAMSADARRCRDVSTRAGNIGTKATMAEERDALVSLVEMMVECAQRAKAQGDPTDPRVTEWIRKHQKKKPRVIVDI